MIGIFKNAKFWIGVGCFAGGLFATSKCARKIAVKSMAAGMQVKDNIKTGWENVKEEAADLYEDAKEEAAAMADGSLGEEIAPAPKKAAKAIKVTTKKK